MEEKYIIPLIPITPATGYRQPIADHLFPVLGIWVVFGDRLEACPTNSAIRDRMQTGNIGGLGGLR
jgi:hypothetical protein